MKQVKMLLKYDPTTKTHMQAGINEETLGKLRINTRNSVKKSEFLSHDKIVSEARDSKFVHSSKAMKRFLFGPKTSNLGGLRDGIDGP